MLSLLQLNSLTQWFWGQRHNALCTQAMMLSLTDFENVSLKDGFSSCSGRLEVKFEGQSWTVSSTDWSEKNSHVICKQLGCGDLAVQVPPNLFIKNPNLYVLNWKMKCDDKLANLSLCKRERMTYHGTQPTVNIFCESMWLSCFFK